MEEALNDALRAAGTLLVEAIRDGLAARGLTADLAVGEEPGRVMLVSRDPAVLQAEMGRAGVAPAAPLSESARDAAGRVVALLRDRVAEAIR